LHFYIQPKAPNGGAASLPAGCTPLCLKSSQLVRTASETNRIEPTPGVISEPQQHQSSLAAKPTLEYVVGDAHPLLTDFGPSALVEPDETGNANHQNLISTTVRDTSIQNTRRLS
jgi:hypothetical protein